MSIFNRISIDFESTFSAFQSSIALCTVSGLHVLALQLSDAVLSTYHALFLNLSLCGQKSTHTCRLIPV